MQQFNMRLDTEFFQTADRERPALGIKSVSAFVRFVVKHFPYKETDRRWSDADMKDFARRWAGRQGNPPGVLEDSGKQMDREFLRFKKDLSNLKTI